jgi:23S rRNA pseudouridine955/2504/2580 synthase/23S rRNA pseudouridine1911/1915/1917 synthase
MERKNSVIIREDQAGKPVLDFVADRFTYRNRTEWQEEIEDGRFLLNDKECKANTILNPGDRLVYLMEEIAEPSVNLNITIIYEDDDLLVVDKPAPLPCHPGGRYFHHTLWAWFKEEHGLIKPSIINRLDRETSGLVLIAKHKEAARLCCQQFADRQVGKRYLVLVEGIFNKKEVKATGSLALANAGVIRKKMEFYPTGTIAPDGAKECSTSFQLLQTANNLSLLAVKPITGRNHQIRATLCSLGFPVVGDKLYGVDETLFLRFREDLLTEADHLRLRLNRQALHAEGLSFQHPISGRQLNFKSPVPKEFAELLEAIV